MLVGSLHIGIYTEYVWIDCAKSEFKKTSKSKTLQLKASSVEGRNYDSPRMISSCRCWGWNSESGSSIIVTKLTALLLPSGPFMFDRKFCRRLRRRAKRRNKRMPTTMMKMMIMMQRMAMPMSWPVVDCWSNDITLHYITWHYIRKLFIVA